MHTDALSKRLEALPKEARREVATLIARLERQQASTPPRTRALRDEPFVGVWKDRPDLADSTAWVRETRQTEWQRG